MVNAKTESIKVQIVVLGILGESFGSVFIAVAEMKAK
jgi:hypothetical protein